MLKDVYCHATCIACGHRERHRRTAFDRRTAPRCSYCGDFLSVSNAQFKRQKGVRKEAVGTSREKTQRVKRRTRVV